MKDLILSILNIFKHLAAILTFVRNAILNILLVAIIIVIIVAAFSTPQHLTPIAEDTILRLDISGDIVEDKRIPQSIENYAIESLNPNIPRPETTLQDILNIIDQASTDDHITVLLLNLTYLGGVGLNQLQLIGQAIERFKETDKFVIAAEDYYSQAQYYLASHADLIILNPMGNVDIHGLGVYRLYVKQALEKLKVSYNIFKIGTHKSALEPFTRDSMSPEDQQQSDLWLSALWKTYTDNIAQQRGVPLEAIEHYAGNIANALTTTRGDPAALALKTGLVDQLWTREQTNSYIDSLIEGGSESSRILSSRLYVNSITPPHSGDNIHKDQVGLIIAEGNIIPGEQPPGIIGGDSLSSLLKEARHDDQIKAVVLRINSGGGSVFASEIIRQEVLELKKSGKPIVVSMGSVAASGGYWIAADADEIWANKATITGSIGIFGAIPTFEKTLDLLGIHSDGTGTTPLAAGIDLTQALPKQIKDAMQQMIAYNYNQFLQIVANGRKIEESKVAALAQGQVYDGITAQNLGLVDKLGSLEDAIQAAAKLAELEDYSTKQIRHSSSIQDYFLRFISVTVATFNNTWIANLPIVAHLTKTLDPHMGDFLSLNDPRNIYAYCPIEMSL